MLQPEMSHCVSLLLVGPFSQGLRERAQTVYARIHGAHQILSWPSSRHAPD